MREIAQLVLASLQDILGATTRYLSTVTARKCN